MLTDAKRRRSGRTAGTIRARNDALTAVGSWPGLLNVGKRHGVDVQADLARGNLT
jgi:hypothetical protein